MKKMLKALAMGLVMATLNCGCAYYYKSPSTHYHESGWVGYPVYGGGAWGVNTPTGGSWGSVPRTVNPYGYP